MVKRESSFRLSPFYLFVPTFRSTSNFLRENCSYRLIKRLTSRCKLLLLFFFFFNRRLLQSSIVLFLFKDISSFFFLCTFPVFTKVHSKTVYNKNIHGKLLKGYVIKLIEFFLKNYRAIVFY